MSTGAYSAAMPVRIGDVRIGALFEQHRGQIVVRVDDGDDQRGGAVRIRDVQIGAAIGQRRAASMAL